MEHIDTVVIGAGHAGLAMSKLLTEHGIGYTVARTRPSSLELALPTGFRSQ